MSDERDPQLTPPPPRPDLEGRIRASLGEIGPVKPLLPPLARAAIVAFLGMGAVTALAAPLADGQPRQTGAMALAVLGLGGLWVAMNLAVPGRTRARLPGMLWLTLPVLFAARMLHAFGAEGGVHGVECLVLGTGIALLPLIAALVLVARAAPLMPALTGAIAGIAAGAFGLALLTLNCPVLEGPHLAVFHAGVLVLSGAVGALAASIIDRAGT